MRRANDPEREMPRNAPSKNRTNYIWGLNLVSVLVVDRCTFNTQLIYTHIYVNESTQNALTLDVTKNDDEFDQQRECVCHAKIL